MRPIVITTFLSLDGVMEAPGGGDHPHAGWTFKDVAFEEAAYDIKGRETQQASALLLGRRSYEEFAPVWPSMEEFTTYNAMPKYVVSTTQRTFAAWEQLSTAEGEETPSELYTRVRREMIAAERAKVLLVRSKGRLASEVVSEVLGMLDIEESMLDAGTEARASVRNTSMAFAGGRICDDLEQFPAIETVADPACATCLADGTRWVSLRQCLTCGHVGCCDSSVGKHATAHFHDTLHPVMQSAEPDEAWRWCYVHNLTG